MKPYKKEVILTTCCVLIFVSINLYLPYITKLIIDGLTENSLFKNDLYYYLSVYTILGTICVIFSRTLRRIPLKLSHKIEYKLTFLLIEKKKLVFLVTTMLMVQAPQPY